MDSGVLLDLLGNENRRRILRLLARRPCYVTEISEYIGVSPKAVIDHLRRLEDAGLVESHVDDQRRKYFHISRNLRLEVNVSPYSFRMKSAYPASANLELKAFHHVSIEAEANGDGTADDATASAVTDLATELGRLQDLERELSVAQRWVQGRMAEVQGELSDAVEEDGNERLYAEVLAALAGGADTPGEVGERAEVPPDVAESALVALADRDLVERGADGWQLA